MSILNITSLELASSIYTQPHDILFHTRQLIIDRLKKDGSSDGGKDGMDCSLLSFDFENKKLHIAAANNPVWIVRNIVGNENDVVGEEIIEDSRNEQKSNNHSQTTKNVIEIKPDKMPVGKSDRDQEPFTLHTIELQKGDIVYTLTDGFPDQFGGPKGKKFMSKNLRELLISNSHLPMHEQYQLLQKTFTNWKGELEQVDDVTVIGIRV